MLTGFFIVRNQSARKPIGIQRRVLLPERDHPPSPDEPEDSSLVSQRTVLSLSLERLFQAQKKASEREEK